MRTARESIAHGEKGAHRTTVEGNLFEEYARWGAKSLVVAVNIDNKFAGLNA